MHTCEDCSHPPWDLQGNGYFPVCIFSEWLFPFMFNLHEEYCNNVWKDTESDSVQIKDFLKILFCSMLQNFGYSKKNQDHSFSFYLSVSFCLLWWLWMFCQLEIWVTSVMTLNLNSYILLIHWICYCWMCFVA